ncbi:MAG TPA: hypothetical protein VE650_02930 [Acetobacteraceae bacterium]|nr:hypothetical protein [Acetobacteraceae bacterium]
MKIGAKNIASGVFFILVALAGLYLNQDHALGTARRMGPGYMPMLVFWIQIGLGALVLANGLFGGPDPMEKWTGVESVTFAAAIAVGVVVGYLAPALGPYFAQTYAGVGLGALAGFLVLAWAAGWRMIALVLAAMCVFALLLEKAGLMVAIVGTIALAALADPDHRARPLGVVGVTVFLLGLCWWVFIRELDIRVPVWPWSN